MPNSEYRIIRDLNADRLYLSGNRDADNDFFDFAERTIRLETKRFGRVRGVPKIHNPMAFCRVSSYPMMGEQINMFCCTTPKCIYLYDKRPINQLNLATLWRCSRCGLGLTSFAVNEILSLEW